MFACPATDDFFRARLDHIIDLRQPLEVLASRMPSQAFEARVARPSRAVPTPVSPCPIWTSLANRSSAAPARTTPDGPAFPCAP